MTLTSRAGSGVLFLLLSANVFAAEKINVEHVSSQLVDNGYYLDARINFELHDDVLDALDHGVDLNIDIIIKVKEKRKWFRDRLYKQDRVKFKLGHRPLSDVYIVTNIGRSEQRQFDRLENALNYLGTIDHYFILNNENLDDGQQLTGSLKAEVNVGNLPPPLKPIAFIANKWQSDSKWRRWAIR